MTSSDPVATSDNGLAAQLLSADTFSHLIADSKALVALELKKKGMALRTAFNVIQKAKPDLVDKGLRALMPEFVHALEPFYTGYRAQNQGSFRDYLIVRDREVASALLTVSDRRVKGVESRAVKSGYERLRGRAEREVTSAMPGIAEVMDKHQRA